MPIRSDQPDQPHPRKKIETLTARQAAFKLLDLCRISTHVDNIDEMLYDLELMAEKNPRPSRPRTPKPLTPAPQPAATRKKTPRNEHEPDPELQIKTLSHKEVIFLTFKFAGVPPTGLVIHACLSGLAHARQAYEVLHPEHANDVRFLHMRQYL